MIHFYSKRGWNVDLRAFRVSCYVGEGWTVYIKVFIVTKYCCWLIPHIWGFLGRVQRITPRLYFLVYYLFCLVNISWDAAIPLFKLSSAHSGSASWDNCGWSFPDELHVSSFPWSVPTLCLDSIISPLPRYDSFLSKEGMECTCQSFHFY